MSTLTSFKSQIESLPSGLSFEMIEVEGGTFWMGDASEDAHKDDKPVHEVQLDTFCLGKYAVTQALWEEVMGENPSKFLGKARPVETISWHDCIEFCNQLSLKRGYVPVYELDKNRNDPHNKNSMQNYWVRWIPDTNGFRLATDAEWEYASRGGRVQSEMEYAGSSSLKKVGWYNENSAGMSQPVGLQAPNELGLYGMSGNVWEWCWDWYNGKYYQKCFDQGIASNPYGAESGYGRVGRGGRWGSGASNCRVVCRLNSGPSLRNGNLGLRLARTA